MPDEVVKSIWVELGVKMPNLGASLARADAQFESTVSKMKATAAGLNISTIMNVNPVLPAELREVEAGVVGIGRASAVATGETVALKDSLGGVHLSAIAVGGAILALGTGIYEAAKKSADYAEHLTNLSKASQLSTDTLQRFGYVLKSYGKDMEAATNSADMLEKKLMGIEQDGGQAAYALREMGISVKDGVTGQLRSMNDIFPEIIKHLQAMTNGTDRNAAAAVTFGRGWKEIAPLISMTNAEFDAMAKKAPIMTHEQIEAGEKFAVMLNQLGAEFEILVVKIGTSMQPVAERLGHTIEGNIPTIISLSKAVAGLIEWFLRIPTPVIIAIAAIAGLGKVSSIILSAATATKALTLGSVSLLSAIGRVMTAQIALSTTTKETTAATTNLTRTESEGAVVYTQNTGATTENTVAKIDNAAAAETGTLKTGNLMNALKGAGTAALGIAAITLAWNAVSNAIDEANGEYDIFLAKEGESNKPHTGTDSGGNLEPGGKNESWWNKVVTMVPGVGNMIGIAEQLSGSPEAQVALGLAKKNSQYDTGGNAGEHITANVNDNASVQKAIIELDKLRKIQDVAIASTPVGDKQRAFFEANLRGIAKKEEEYRKLLADRGITDTTTTGQGNTDTNKEMADKQRIASETAKLAIGYKMQEAKISADADNAEKLAAEDKARLLRELGRTYDAQGQQRIAIEQRVAEENASYAQSSKAQQFAGIDKMQKEEAGAMAAWAKKIDDEQSTVQKDIVKQQMQEAIATYKTSEQAKLDIALSNSKTAHEIALSRIKDEGDAKMRVLERLRSAEDTMLQTTVLNNPWARAALAAVKSAPDAFGFSNASSNQSRSLLGVTASAAPQQTVHVIASVDPANGNIRQVVHTTIDSMARGLSNSLAYGR